MSSYAIEILAKGHDRAGFVSGLESVDRYLWETARGHQEKGISVTRVMVKAEETPPKTVVGFFTLSNITSGFTQGSGFDPWLPQACGCSCRRNHWIPERGFNATNRKWLGHLAPVRSGGVSPPEFFSPSAPNIPTQTSSPPLLQNLTIAPWQSGPNPYPRG
jgi:hypothetical protein